MKILISSESYWPNKDGGAVFERRLVHQLIEAGHEVRLVVPGNSWRSYQEPDGKSHIYRTASVRLPLNKDYKISYYARSQVIKALNEFQPDIIHVHTIGVAANSLITEAKKRHIPIVATNHIMPENFLMSLPKAVMNSKAVNDRFWKELVRFHEKFLAVSTPTQTAAELLKKYGLKKPLFAISNGVDTNYFHPLSDQELLTSDPELERFKLPGRYFIYLGRVNAEKRIDMLLRSFALAAHETPDLHLVIAGTGNRSEQLKQLAKELSIDKKIQFVGRVSEEEKRALYQHAEFFAITSPAELQSIVTLEAAACGLPVIAVDIAALRELCHNDKNGYLVKLDDNKACAQAIEQLYKSKSRRDAFGAYSRKLIEDEHSQENTLQEYVRFYETAIKSAATAPEPKKRLL
jgi:glycosyltransferase involved in cell wall biosynthesis